MVDFGSKIIDVCLCAFAFVCMSSLCLLFICVNEYVYLCVSVCVSKRVCVCVGGG
jgi:hypothetical protein